MASTGEALIRLLADYGIDTVFGIPGVHTLEFCRALSDDGRPGTIRHVRARHELGAGFMAEGWARATGRPGVAVVISGPGVTNAATALGQCWADSLPLLLISAEAESASIGRGRGVLHEISEQRRATEPLTALSVSVRRPEELPEALARAFALFACDRPRPVHISVPIDVQEAPAGEGWQAVEPPAPPAPDPATLAAMAARLAGAERPLIIAGGGATGAGAAVRRIAEALEAPVATTIAGKGIVPDSHPLALGAAMVRREGVELIAGADAILAIGTELAETDCFEAPLRLTGTLLRIDRDRAKLAGEPLAAIGLCADARPAAEALATRLEAAGPARPRPGWGREAAAALRARLRGPGARLSEGERRHVRLLEAMRAALPDETMWFVDATQPAYTGAFAMPMEAPRRWHYPTGYCALGCALPGAIGASLARPGEPVVALAGDGGFMFTAPELLTAADLGLSLPVVVWDNGAYGQIRDDMRARGIAPVGVGGLGPDWRALAAACRAAHAEPADGEELGAALRAALAAGRPTLIRVDAAAPWLGA